MTILGQSLQVYVICLFTDRDFPKQNYEPNRKEIELIIFICPYIFIIQNHE